MKKNCFHRFTVCFLLLSFWCVQMVVAQQIDTLFIDDAFQKINIKPYSKNLDSEFNGSRDFYYFSFKNEYNRISFCVKNNQDTSQKLILELTNAQIEEVIFSKYNGNHIFELYKTGIEHPVSSKPVSHRLFAFPLELNAYETGCYQLALKKESGKPLVSSIYLKKESVFLKQNSIHQIILGIYFGISILSILFSLFAFFILKKGSYLIYALYIIFLGLFISSYTGLFSQLFLSDGDLFSKYRHYVLFSEISLLLFVIFSQKILETKDYLPKLKKAIDMLLIVLVSIRLLIHFVFTAVFEEYVSLFMNLWYLFFMVLVILVAIQIILFFRTNPKRSSFFAFAYVFMIIGVFVTILYHSYGLVNALFYDLPVVFYTSFLEILFLTLTVILMVKDIYDERNALSEKLVVEEKKNLTAFIKGEDKERRRISKELHDNIGSQLGYLKRFVSDKINDEDVSNAIDTICDDVRNLSHEISPSDINFIGFNNALSDLAKNLRDQTTLNVDFSSYNFPEELDENTEMQLYRVVQETLNNILKHADAKNIDIQLIGQDKHAIIAIEDDGKGFNINNANEGLGLKNIASRIEQIGGKIEIDSTMGKGTSVLISIPK